MNRFAKLSAVVLVAMFTASSLGLAEEKKPKPPPPKPPEFWTNVIEGGNIGPVVGTAIGQPIGGSSSDQGEDASRVTGSCSGKKKRC